MPMPITIPKVMLIPMKVICNSLPDFISDAFDVRSCQLLLAAVANTLGLVAITWKQRSFLFHAIGFSVSRVTDKKSS
jgi:hypothetical protein